MNDRPMNEEVRSQIEGGRAAHARLSATLDQVTDAVVRQPSRLEGWTVGHVLTHIARNADSIVRRINGAISDEVVDQYEGGYEGRAAGIEAGSSRSAAAIVADVRATSAQVDQAWSAVPEGAWERLTRSVGGNLLPLHSLPFSRWREVEVHHADLGLGYSYQDWPEEYVALELARQLERLPGRIDDAGVRHRLCAWLMGRAQDPGPLDLGPWG